MQKGLWPQPFNWNLVVNKSNGKLLRKVSCEVSRLVVGKTNDCDWIHFRIIFAIMFSGLPTFEHTYMCLMSGLRMVTLSDVQKL